MKSILYCFLTAGLLFVLAKEFMLAEPLHFQILSSANSLMDWQPLVHRSNNAFLLWRENPLFHFPSILFESSYIKEFRLAGVLQLFFFFLGSYFFLLKIRASDGAYFVAASFSLIVFLLFGWDSVLLGTMVWIPFLLRVLWSSSEVSGRNKTYTYYFSLILVVTLVCFSANQLSLIVVLACFFAAGLYGQEIPVPAFIISICLPSLCYFFLIPPTGFPDYPGLARVVSDDGIRVGVKSLLGGAFPIPVIDRHSLMGKFSSFSLVLSILSLGYFLGLFWLNKSASRWFVLAVVFSLFALLDSIPFEVVRLCMPLAVLARLIPGSFLYPSTALCLVLALLWITAGLWSLYRPAVVSALYLVLSCTLVYLVGESPGPGVVQHIEQDSLRTFLLGSSAKNRKELPIAVLVSPSYHVLRSEGPHIMETAKIIDHLSFSTLEDKVLEAKASHQTEKASLAVDGDSETKWATGVPGQLGLERFSLRLREAIEFDALELDLGVFRTDFPRGLRVRVAPECSELEGSGQTIYEAAVWQGKVELSANSYPYYGGQDQVKIMFDRSHKAQCIYLEQIARGKRFEWSVAELKVHQTGP